MEPPRDVRIHLAPASVVTTLFILAAAALLWYLHNIILIVVTAVVIASAIEPGVRGLTRRRVPRVLAVLIMYALVIGVFAGALYFFVPLVLKDAAQFLNAVPALLQSFVGTSGTGAILPLSDIASLFASSNFVQNLAGALSGTTGSLLAIVAAFFGGLVSFVLIIVFSFYFCVQETGVDDFLSVVTPPHYHDYVIGLWKRARDKIGRWMQGQLLLAAIVGVLLFLGLTVLQIPYALLLAIVAAVCELIPVFGQLLAMIPAVAVAFGADGTSLALVVAGLFLLVQQFEAHLIYPLVVRKVVGIPPLLVILALLVGGELAGFLGVLLSVPIATVLREFIADIERKRVLAREGK
ncbi:MAG: AI-2E family transporter [Minisyncoccia bacterium]